MEDLSGNRVWLYCRAAHDGPDSAGLLEFHTTVRQKRADVLLTQNISWLGRDVDKVIRYWYFLRDHSVRVHTVVTLRDIWI